MRTIQRFILREDFLPYRNELVTQCAILLHLPNVQFTKLNKNTSTFDALTLVKLKMSLYLLSKILKVT